MGCRSCEGREKEVQWETCHVHTAIRPVLRRFTRPAQFRVLYSIVPYYATKLPKGKTELYRSSIAWLQSYKT